MNQIEILLVEDNQYDAELIIHSLKKVNLENNLVHVKDGEEALDYIFSRGAFKGQPTIVTDHI